MCSRRQLEKCLREGFAGERGDVAVRCTWEEGIACVGDDGGVVHRLLVCQVDWGGDEAEDGAAAMLPPSRVEPRHVVTLGRGWRKPVCGEVANAPHPPPPPRIPPATDQYQEKRLEFQSDAMLALVAEALQLQRSQHTPQAPGGDAGLHGAAGMLHHREHAVRRAALDLLLAWARRDSSSRDSVASAVTSLDAVLDAGRPGTWNDSRPTKEEEVEEEGEGGGSEGKAAALAALLSESREASCGVDGAKRLAEMVKGGGEGAESCLRAAATLALRDENVALLVKFGLPEAARDAAVSAGQAGGGLRRQAFSFISRVLHVDADGELITPGFVRTAVESLASGESGGGERIGAAGDHSLFIPT